MDERAQSRSSRASGPVDQGRVDHGRGGSAEPVREARLARQRRPVRVLAGLILLAAVLLLWPFAAWSWWPVLIGFGVLVLLYLLRLDRLLFGWAPHLAGLVVVVLLAARSDPWAWGLAAGLAILGVGFTRLPGIRVLAVGAVFVVLCGAGYGITHYRSTAQQQAEQAAQDRHESLNLSAVKPGYVVPFLASYLAAGDDKTVCPMLTGASAAQFAAALGAPDCRSAVHRFAGQVSNQGVYRSVALPWAAVAKTGDTATVDGCRARWPGGAIPGPALGRFGLTRYQNTDRYLIISYTPCR
jgi:hypothetical protein